MTSQRKRVGAKALAALLAAMVTKPHTYDELAAIAGISRPVISAWVTAMRERKLVHIGDWRADARGSLTIPAFVWGFYGLDMPRPPAKPAKQRVAEWRARQVLA